MTPKNMNAAFWAGMVKAAKKGDVTAARDMLENVAEMVEQAGFYKEPDYQWFGLMIPWEAADYLAKAFRSILNGEDPAKALNLVALQRGRQKGKAVTHNMEALAASYFLLTRMGLKSEQANCELSAALGADRATIYRARKEYSEFGNQIRFCDESLRVTLRPYAAEVNAILKRRKK